MNKIVNPWELQTSDARSFDNRYTFLVFCEDTVCEPLYFKSLENDMVNIETFGNQKSSMGNVLKALAHCSRGSIDSGSSGISVWCVFDFDKDNNENTKHNKIVAFNESLETARRRNVNVAWSNDAFELWILLHFEDVDALDESSKTRQAYYDRLTDIFKNLPEKPGLLQKSLAHNSFNYKKDCKQERMFTQVVLPEITNKQKIAIERAKTLAGFHSNKTNAHEKTPCTFVHTLVEEIQSKSSL